MKKILILFLFLSFYGNCQDFRSYADNANEASKLCKGFKGMGFSTEKEANQALDEILSVIGASRRFILQSCENIPNASAISLKGIRYIFYNQEFMEEINTNTNYWSNMSILAHEVGHHINGHTIDAILIINDIVEEESLVANRKMELEADEFSGFVLGRLGATLAQATKTIALNTSDEDDSYSTHPARSKRLNAIERGYNNAVGQSTVVYVSEKSEDDSKSQSEEVIVSEVNKDDSDPLKDDEGFYYRGQERLESKNYTGAINDFTKVIEITSNNFLKSSAFFYRGFAYYDINNYKSSIMDYDSSFFYDPDDLSVIFNRALSKEGLGDDYGAIQDYSLIINIDPYYGDAYFSRGLLRFNRESYRVSIDDFLKYIEIQGEDSELISSAYYNIGSAKANLEEDGCEYYLKAYDLGDLDAKKEIEKYGCNISSKETLFYTLEGIGCEESEADLYREVSFDRENKPVGEIINYFMDGTIQATMEGAIKIDRSDDNNSLFTGIKLHFSPAGEIVYEGLEDNEGNNLSYKVYDYSITIEIKGHEYENYEVSVYPDENSYIPKVSYSDPNNIISKESYNGDIINFGPFDKVHSFKIKASLGNTIEISSCFSPRFRSRVKKCTVIDIFNVFGMRNYFIIE